MPLFSFSLLLEKVSIEATLSTSATDRVAFMGDVVMKPLFISTACFLLCSYYVPGYLGSTEAFQHLVAPPRDITPDSRM